MNKALLGCFCLVLTLQVPAWPRQSSSAAAGSAQGGAVAAAQAPAAAAGSAHAASSVPALKAVQGLMKLDVVVTDAAGKPVTGLEAKDFTLLDNGEPGKIVSFQAFDGAQAKPDPPVELILILDAINLTSEHKAFAEQEVKRFLLRNGGHLVQPVSIYLLSNFSPLLEAPASSDGNALAAEMTQKKGLRSIGQSKTPTDFGYFGATPIMSAQNWKSVTALGTIVMGERRKPGNKLLVWVGDGWPAVASGGAFEWITELSTRLREARVHLSSVTAWPDNRDFDYRSYVRGMGSAKQVKTETVARSLTLPVLAAQSGGRVLGPDKDLVSLIDRCAEDASAFYTISFDPPRAEEPDEYHALELRADKPEFAVRTNSGYYNEPIYYDQPLPKIERVTVKQLEQEVETGKGVSDAEMARQFYGQELTERLSSARLLQWKARLPGAKSWAALVALADASAFLAPPAAEISAAPAPDVAAQRQMFSLVIHYLTEAIPRLPNFFATRTTVRYEEPPDKDEQTWKIPIGDWPLRMDSVSSATVLYRDGAEQVDPATMKGKKLKADERGLETTGAFGTILSRVIVDTAHGHLKWGRWEQGAGGAEAVFRYVIPKDSSQFYQVTLCCLTDMEGSRVFQSITGYHGEIAIDPATGSILRLTVEADLEPDLPLNRSDVMVEYGPVEIGGKTYICPLHSVSISRGRTLRRLQDWGEAFSTYGPFETMLNDVSFSDYHVFRSESRMLIGDNPAPEK